MDIWRLIRWAVLTAVFVILVLVANQYTATDLGGGILPLVSPVP